jgi:hypothetical protein
MATPDAVVKFNAATDSFEVFGATSLGGGGGGGGDVTSADLASAIAAHNTSGAAHEDIRQAVTDEASARASAITTHGSDTTTHADIRNAITAEATARGDAIAAHNTDADAHSAKFAAVNNRIDSVENLGQHAGSFDTFAELPTAASAFAGITANDFVTIRNDETRDGATTRYVVDDITGGVITWEYDVTYSTDITGKMDLVAGATAGNFAALAADGSVVDSGKSAADFGAAWDDAVAAHNIAGTAHADIRQAVADEGTARAAAITAHDGDTLAHGDIRQLVLDEAGLRAAAVTAQSNALTSAVSGLTASIGEVNTALGGKLDASAAAGFAPINSPNFTGTPTAPTPGQFGGKTARVATITNVRAAFNMLEQWVRNAFDSIGETAPPMPTGYMGARWFKNQPATTLTRLGDAVGLNFTPAVVGLGGSSDFDTMPVYRDIKLCNLVDGVVTAYYGDANFSRTPASGDVMVEIPKYYYKVVEDTDTRDYLISDFPIDDTWFVSPRHAPTSENPNGWEKIYVSAYTLNSNYQSVSGNQSRVSITRATARANCANRGTGYWQYDFATYWTINLLYLVEVANWNSQAAIGTGNVSTTTQISTGDSDDILFHSGGIVNGVRAVKYRHMENLWGNITVWVDGININNYQSYISLIPSQYADDTANNYNALSYIGASTNGFIQGLGFDVNYPFAQICVGVGGSATTYIPDEYSSSPYWRVLGVGGAMNRGNNSGLFFFYAANDPTTFGTAVGCRLICLPE